MKILEVRDGFIKFEADKNIHLSSFIQIDGMDKSYVAQVIQLKRSGENSIGYAKILFLYTNGELGAYDKTLPSNDCEISEFTFEILKNSINSETPVIAGKTADNKWNIEIDSSAFDKKMLISVDEKADNNTIVKNLTKQFNNLSKKVLIIDTLGVIEAKKFVAGVDFKLPLNKESLAFMYKDCLDDATAESKSLIIEIFRDLAEYSESVPFVPFEALKTIVDTMVEKEHVFKLLVLKNKLVKFAKLGYFASKQEEIDNLKTILGSKCAIIDLTKLDPVFLNRYIGFIYEVLGESSDTQVFLELSNVVSKKSIKDVLSNQNVATTLITHSKFKYLNDIKNVFDNFIIVPAFANNEIFNIYSTFLKSMRKDSYLVVGEATNYIPLVSPLMEIDELPAVEQEEIIEEEPESEEELEELIAESEPEPVEEETPEEEASEELEEVEEITPPPTSVFEEDPEVEEEIQEEPAKYEELTISESFETEIHPSEEIVDYVPEPEEPALELEEEPAIEQVEALPEQVEEMPEIIEEVEEENIEEHAEEVEEEIELPSGMELEELEELPEIEMLPEEEASEVIEEEPEQEEELQVLPLNNDSEDFDEIIELDPLEADENDILIEMEEEDNEELTPESLDEQIVKDVDKVFTQRREEEISDSDLDFIDELNSDDSDILEEIAEEDNTLEELAEPEEDGILEEVPDESIKLQEAPVEEFSEESEILETRNSATPIVPVYNADIPQEDMVVSDPIQQGDIVMHAKYGNGVVEKMIKYGNKTLFSINFDNIGRRLLDPTLTEIKKS